MKKRKIQWSFKKELLICFVLLALLPLIISNCFLIQIFQTIIAQNEEKSAREQLEKLESVMLTRFDELEEAVEQLSKNQQIKSGINTENRWEKNKVYNELYRQTEGLREYAQFHIYNAQGKCMYSTGDELYDTDMPVYWGIMKVAKAHTDEMVIRNATGYHTVEGLSMQAARALCNEEDECLGYIVMDFVEYNFDNMFRNVYDEENALTLLDSFWEEIYSTKNAKAGNIALTIRERRMDGKAINQETDKMQFYINEVGETGLYLVLGKPTIFTQEVIGQMLVILVVMTALSLLFCLVVAEILSSNLSRPVQRLSDAMQIAQNGNLDIQLNSKRNDELGQLTQNFNHMTKELKNYMELQVRQEKELNDANIAMMHAQLNPHFLYNTLDTMKWIAKANHIQELATLASGLARILRMSITDDKFIPLSEELRMVECYIDIQRIRFHDRFTMDIEVPMELEDCRIPKLIIQPIVENAVIHGLSECEEGHIFLNIYARQKIMYIEVSDDGCGMDEELVALLNSRDREKLRGHLGFCNVDTILCLYYGEQFGLHVQNLQTGGTKVTITLPIETQGQEDE